MTPVIDAEDLGTWWAGVADILLQEARHADSEYDNLRLLMDAARVRAEECSDLDGGYSLYLECHQIAPRNPRVLRTLARLSCKKEDWASAKDWLEKCVAEEGDALIRTEIRLELAELLAMRLGESREALEVLWAALDETPQSEPALLMLALLLGESDLEGQAELLRRRLVLVKEPDDRINVLLQLGHIESLRGGEGGDALTAYQEAYALDNSRWASVLGVYRCLIEAANWPDLQAFVSDAIAAAPRGEGAIRLRLLYEVLQGTHFGEVTDPSTLHALESVLGQDLNARLDLAQLSDASSVSLSVDPEGAGPLQAALNYRAGLVHERNRSYEAAADAYDRTLTADPRMAIAYHAQRRATARLGDYDDYVAATEKVAEVSESASLRSSLLTHLGMVHEFGFKQASKAAEYYDRAVGAHLSAIGGPPVHEIPALNDLVRTLEATLDPKGFDQALADLIRDCAEPSQVAWLYDTRAELALTKQGDTDRAVEFYGRAADLDPDNFHAHRVRQDVYRRRRDWSSLLSAIEAELQEAQSTRRLQLLSQLADIHLQLGSPAAAEAAWRQALDLDAHWFPAHIGLGQLLDGQGRWRELGEQLAYQLATLEGGAGQRAALLGRLAEIYEFRLDLPEKAESAYLELLKLKGAAPDAIAGLERVYAQSGKWPELIEVLEGYAEATEAPGARSAIHIRIADLLHVHLSDLEGAIQHYRSAVALDPAQERAQWGLEWLLIESGDQRALDTHYQNGSMAGSEGARMLLLHKRLAITPVGQREEIAALILADEPSDLIALWTRVVTAAERRDDTAVADALIELASHLEARELRSGLILEGAERLFGGDRGRQASIWEDVIQASPDNERGWQALLGLYTQGDDLESLRDYLYRVQDGMTHKGSRSTAYWMAAMLSDQIGHHDRALEELRRAYEICPDDVIPLWLMLHRGAYKDTAEQAALMERLADRLVHREEAAQLYFEAGRLRDTTLHDQQQAAANYQSALMADPSLQAAADQLEQVLIGQDRLDELLDLSLQRARAAKDPDLKAALLLRCARSERRLNNRPESAIALLEDLLATVPGHEMALREIADALVDLGRDAEAAGYYEVLIEGAEDEAALGKAYLELGRLRLASGETGAEAVELFRRAVSVTSSPTALTGLGDAYFSTGDYDLAQLTFRRLERMKGAEADRLTAILGQVEALLAAERPAEALRRMNKADDAPACPDALGRVARILASFRELPEGLHGRLSDILTTRTAPTPAVDMPDQPPLMPAKAASQPLTADEGAPSGVQSGDASFFDPSGSEPASMTGYAIDIGGEGSTSGDRKAGRADSRGRSLTDVATWTSLATAYPEHADWYQEIASWAKGERAPIATTPVLGPIPEAARMGACPEGVPLSAVRLLGVIVRALESPLAAGDERAEVAAEGQRCDPKHPIYQRMTRVAGALGLDNAVLVRSAARPFTLDLYRKTPPVITFGSSLLDGLDLDRASFPIGALLLPISEGLLPPRYTAAGRSIDDDRFEAILGASLKALGFPMVVSEGAAPLVQEYQERIEAALSADTRVELEPLAKQTHAKMANISAGEIRSGLDRYITRLAAVMSDSLGGALDALRQLDFDDRPREALTVEHIHALVRDNETLLDLLKFAQSDECRAIRSALRRG